MPQVSFMRHLSGSAEKPADTDLPLARRKKGMVFLALSSITFLILLAYAFVHAWEYDEAWTYLSVKNESFADLIAYKNFNIANNHLINSLWFKLLYSGGFDHVLFYRGASLLSFIPYACFLYKAATYRSDGWKKNDDWYLALFFLPPVIFFFASGRGYSIAVACFCAALYYMKVFLAEKTARSYWLFFLFGVLSSLSIVSFVFPFLAMIAYIHIKNFPPKILSLQNILSAVLLAGLLLYIYHIGKTILRHDPIINGTDNLFMYGMYSTFISFLNISILAFPWKHLYAQMHLGLLTKLWVLLTLIPLLWIVVKKYRTRYAELVLMFIMTLLFLAAHFILNSKYPSDRSVIYLLYLLYIPVVLHIVRFSDPFFKLHYYSVLLFGFINFAAFLYEATKPTVYSFFKKQPVREYAIVSDWPNLSDSVYNELEFGKRLKFSYIVKEYETDIGLIDSSIRNNATKGFDFLLLQAPNYERNKAVFENGFSIRPIMSTNSKEFFLIQRQAH